jgi:hypothetical protein
VGPALRKRTRLFLIPDGRPAKRKVFDQAGAMAHGQADSAGRHRQNFLREKAFLAEFYDLFSCLFLYQFKTDYGSFSVSSFTDFRWKFLNLMLASYRINMHQSILINK